MSRKGIKIHTRCSHPTYENEPEEGEIIDDYDLIVSSDEELSMRQRILELEAENEEIEQIAVISRSYVDKISHSHNHLEVNRAAQVPTDASSISSTEFVTPRKRRRSKEHKRKHCHRQSPREHSHQYDQSFRYDLQKLPQKTHSKKAHCKRRQKLFAKKHKKFQSDRIIHKDINADSLTLESLESSDSSSIADTANYNSFKTKGREYEYAKEKYITRDTLRMAVARNTSNDSKALSNNKCCLKDKLLKQELVGQSSKTKEHFYAGEPVIRVDNDDDDDVQVIESEPIIQTIDEDSTDSIEEKELRLIALKSAVLKKHMARKMRNAAVAYSPTDFDEMLSSGLLRSDSKMDDIDIVDLDADDSQPACVSASPDASPQLTMLDDQEESQQMVDCKPVDMDIANSDSEDATIDSWTKVVDSCLNKYSADSYEFANNLQYGFIMQKLHELPPPPPGVDDYENAPPPPPYHMLYDAEMQDMDLDNEDFAEAQPKLGGNETFSTEHKTINANAELTFQTTDCHIKEQAVQGDANDDGDDEEEEALRALLLSKFKSPKNQKKSSDHKDFHEFKDIDSLKNNEFSSQKTCKNKPTEIILKEAVKRLKIHSQIESCKEEKDKTIDSFATNDLFQEFSEKNSEHVFERLRDRLNLYKSQTHSNADPSQYNANELPRDPNESAINAYNDDKCDKTLVSDTSEVTSVIDISDITRRLQKIKETVLNSIAKATESSHTPNEKSEISENVGCSNEPSMENLHHQLNKPITNDVIHIVPTSGDINASLTREKTVESNFDVCSNKTTFKVTIKNNAALKTDIADTLMNIFPKDTDDNKQLKALPMKNDGGSFNAHSDNERLTKNTCSNTKESNTINKATANTTATATKPTANYKVTSQTKYSLLRATKIVKPNKVINNNFNLNQQKQVLCITNDSQIDSKSLKSELNNKSTAASDSPRLITSLDQVTHMCKIAPIIINLQNSSNESSEEEEAVGDYNSLYKPLYDYNDNASPLSLNLESPSITPLRSTSPVDSNADGIIANSKLGAFNLITKETPKHKQIIARTSESDKINKTPLAVRHLPAAAQAEYRKLVHRMKLLENKRKLTTTEDKKAECISHEQTNTNSPSAENANKERIKSDTADPVLKSSLVKKVLIKNASNITTSSVAATANDMPSKTSKLHKSNVLRSYENLYVKFGSGIVNNLDKSLKLVEEAKKAKIAKIKLESRLRQLKIEMDILQSKQREEQQKISRIYPSICSTNEFIASLKQKRTKIYKAAISLGKTVKGDAYRLNNDLKEVIINKTKRLATEIKTVNSLKVQDIKNKDVFTDPKLDADQQIEKDKNQITIKPEETSNEIEVDQKTIANGEIVCSETREERGEESPPESLLKTDICGNTEFQNLETNVSKSCESTEDSCRPDHNTNLDTTALEIDSENTTKPLPSYISPLEHLRNIDSNVDPNGVVCPYDLMGKCEDVTCKYIHISPKAKT